jgi:uncharacterized protein YraI
MMGLGTNVWKPSSRGARRVVASLLAAVAVGATTVGLSGSALAWAPGTAGAATGTVHTGSALALNVRTGPGTNNRIIGSLPNGTRVTIQCYATGTAETGPWGTSRVWDNIGNSRWVSDAFVFTGSNNPVAPHC